MACHPIGHDLVVRDHHNNLDTKVLEPDAIGQAAEVVPDVQ